jgi:hypothetical protein
MEKNYYTDSCRHCPSGVDEVRSWSLSSLVLFIVILENLDGNQR